MFDLVTNNSVVVFMWDTIAKVLGNVFNLWLIASNHAENQFSDFLIQDFFEELSPVGKINLMNFELHMTGRSIGKP